MAVIEEIVEDEIAVVPDASDSSASHRPAPLHDDKAEQKDTLPPNPADSKITDRLERLQLSEDDVRGCVCERERVGAHWCVVPRRILQADHQGAQQPFL
jgi:hypothetical protein